MNKRIIILFALLLISNFLVIGQKKVSIKLQQVVYNDSTDESQLKGAKGNFGVSISSTNVSCFGECDGSITVTLTGSPTYPVQIRLTLPPDQGGGYVFFNNLQASNFPFTISNLCGSSAPYTVRVRDSDNSIVTVGNIYVLAPAQMSIEEGDYDVFNESCNGACDGGISIYYVTNAQGNVYYSWSSGDTTSNITDKCAGTYTVTVTDDMGCTKDFSFDISAPPALLIDSIIYTPVFCNGGSGSLTIYASGGNPPYVYNIGSGYFVGNTFNGLAAGTYSVTVMDNNNCTVTGGPVTINENPAIVLTETHVDVRCYGTATGSIDLTVNGGTTPYNYNWQGPNGFTANTEDISNLEAGNYDVTVTDANSCTSTLSVIIGSATAIDVSETHTNVSCNGGSNGTISLTVNGGTPPYSYTWTGPSCPCSGSSLTNLAAGTYRVTVTDANSCTTTLTINITQPDSALSATETHTNVSCHGGNDGSITLSVSGGTAPYTYTWTGPSCPCSGS
ncbi:MAG: SprB repeat-containing protein, partial [Bacteroidales bacterium]